MDKIIETWKDFLTKKKDSYQIYCDMDGVLVDLEAGIEEEIDLTNFEDESEDTPEEDFGVTRKQAIQVLNSGILWHKLQGEGGFNKGVQAIFDVLDNGGEKFWAELPPRSDVTELWRYIQEFNPIILSAPWKLENSMSARTNIDSKCVEGKRKWLGRLDPPPGKIIIAGTESGHEGNTSKHRYAKNPQTGLPNILIDDMDFYLSDWAAEGGIAIKHTSAKETIKKLEFEQKKLRKLKNG